MYAHNEADNDYDHQMQGAAEAEAEAQQAYEYEKFINDLAVNNVQLFALYHCIDLLTSQSFKKSGMTDIEYLIRIKNELEQPKAPSVANQDTDDLPW